MSYVLCGLYLKINFLKRKENACWESSREWWGGRQRPVLEEARNTGGRHVLSPVGLSSKAGLSRPGSSVQAGRDADVRVGPEQSASGDKVAGRSMTVVPFSFSISV